MSLEAARTRRRMHQAHLAQMLPESGVATLMGYSLCPIHSPVFQTVAVCDAGAAEVTTQAAVATAIPTTCIGSSPDHRALICLAGLDAMLDCRFVVIRL